MRAYDPSGWIATCLGQRNRALVPLASTRPAVDAPAITMVTPVENQTRWMMFPPALGTRPKRPSGLIPTAPVFASTGEKVKLLTVLVPRSTARKVPALFWDTMAKTGMVLCSTWMHVPALVPEHPARNCPALQGAHAVHVPGPLVPEHPSVNCAAGQAVHAVQVPALLPEHPTMYWPALQEEQAVHVPALVPEHPDRNWPALHVPHPVHVPELVPEHPVLYCPAGQAEHAVHVPGLNDPHPTMYSPAGQVAQIVHVPGMATPCHPSLVPEHPRLYCPPGHAVQGSHVPQSSREQPFLYWPTSQPLHGVQAGPLVEPYSPHAGVKNPAALQTSQVVQLPALPIPQFIL